MKIKVCVGSNCLLLGAMGILDQIEFLEEFIVKDSDHYNEEVFDVEAIKCLGICKETDEKLAPIVVINDEVIYNSTSQAVMEKILSKLKRN